MFELVHGQIFNIIYFTHVISKSSWLMLCETIKANKTNYEEPLDIRSVSLGAELYKIKVCTIKVLSDRIYLTLQ